MCWERKKKEQVSIEIQSHLVKKRESYSVNKRNSRTVEDFFLISKYEGKGKNKKKILQST